MQSKNVKKLAVIREKGETPCPYGLDIPDGCKNAGNCVLNMQPITDKSISKDSINEVIDANKRILLMDSSKIKCKYANYIFENDKVECGFGDNGHGTGPVEFRGTPTMTGYIGLLAVPPYERELDWSSTFGLNGTYYNTIANTQNDNIEKNGTEDDGKNK